MTCKGLNCHVSIIQERKDHYKEERRLEKKQFCSAQNTLGLQYAGEEAEDRFAVQEVSEI